MRMRYFRLGEKHSCCLYIARFNKRQHNVRYYRNFVNIAINNEIAELDRECISCGGQNGSFCKDCCEPRCD